MWIETWIIYYWFQNDHGKVLITWLWESCWNVVPKHFGKIL